MTPADPVVLCGADEAFAMPLAATIASIRANLAPQRRLQLFVLDGGMSSASVEKILSMAEPPQLGIEVLQPDLSEIQDLPVTEHVSAATYLRLLMPRILPATVERVIYLDSDMIVLADLGALWDEPMDRWHCLAVQEVAAPVLDARLALPSYKRSAPYLATNRPIPNYRQLGFPPCQKYFNCGLLVADLARWRRDDIAVQLFECLAKHRRHVRWWDQYALNVVLANRIGELDSRWNQVSAVYRFPSWQCSPLSAEAFQALRQNPFIVHFNARQKPWHRGSGHLFRDAFFRYLEMTPWAGTPAADPAWNFQRWMRERIEDVLVFGGRRYRWLAARFC